MLHVAATREIYSFLFTRTVDTLAMVLVKYCFSELVICSECASCSALIVQETDTKIYNMKYNKNRSDVQQTTNTSITWCLIRSVKIINKNLKKNLEKSTTARQIR